LPPPPQKVLIALTRSSLSTAEEIQNDILSDYQVDLLPIIAHEPSVSSVQEVTNDVMLGAPDWIIAIGGGSVMDAAKAAAIIATNGGNVEGHLRGTQTIEHQGIPLIAIPTTSGLGSEVTPYASVTDTQENRKISLSHDYLFPKFALLDSSLTLTLTPRQTAISGMDALSHAIEGYWSKRATPATDALALGASRLVFDQLARLKNSPKDLAARRLAMEGSMLAGLTISNAQTTAVHAVSYPITVFYGVHHGLACYLLLPAMIRFNSGAIAPDKEQRLLENLGVDSMVHMAESVECLQSQLELPSRLADVGIGIGEISKIVENGYWPDRMANNPKAISAAQLATMLEERI
jgi:alcohol dehydrogenase